VARQGATHDGGQNTNTNDDDAGTPTIMTDGGVDTVMTGYRYKDPDTCGLYASGHRIAADFADVLDAFEDAFDHGDATVVAGGCNGCTHVGDANVWANYVAQGSDDIDSLFVGYGASDDTEVTAADVAALLVIIARDMGVPVSWNGDTSKKVCLGDADAYDESFDA